MASLSIISGKDLGALAMPDFCERCFWFQRHAPAGLPYQIFPGIFSSIDSYTKKVVQSWFDRKHSRPYWLAGLGDIETYIESPHYSKFSYTDPTTGITLRGTPDAVFRHPDGSLTIADYKTAKFTAHQDHLHPIYATQLNAYAFISELIGFGSVSRLALIYTEPITDEQAANVDDVHHESGFLLGFSTHILPIELNTGAIPAMLSRVKVLVSLDVPPVGRVGCKDCERLIGLFNLIAGQ